ncbi:spinster family MFS transporter [Aestuariirhabdus litorea]|uniref:MFS transporter n=1 Tax=Aestuariirhabdus litorea TaxID=2528527 RepID=A0A3P3VMT6_9GAMM|nr:MFS transporter [Aestuariirhabdus litorea]RRJ83995.1 MFS transporter [Aestuariirhabdus litorea]RWW97215.1 MFS transporter [Endozoicomonadaceae bacterium GTF-13]
MPQPPLVPPSSGYRRYVLILLTFVYALNFIDRQILVILQESIKQDMDLSDSQLGLLTGFAFAIFYVSVGIPIARWADVGNRRNIVSIALALWSGMTALSGLTQNYLQLLLARIGVGVGEAGGSPPAHSIISDYYPPAQRGRALSFYSMGVYVGILLGFLVGGWINQHYGWRIAFFAVGLPGILVALLVRFSVREPHRGASDGLTQQDPVSLSVTLGTLWKLRSFRYFSLAAGLTAFTSYGAGNFLPSFLIRSHGLSVMEVGVSLSLIVGVGGAIGTYLGGFIADRLGQQEPRWYLWVSAIMCLLGVPLTIVACFAGNSSLVLGLLFFSTLFGACYLGPTIAITHSLVSPGMRAIASAVLFFILNLVGLGLGPLAVGVISDLLAPSLGSDSLRYAIAIAMGAGVLASAGFAIAAARLPEDLKRSAAPSMAGAEEGTPLPQTT